jgi:hypothetical protein
MGPDGHRAPIRQRRNLTSRWTAEPLLNLAVMNLPVVGSCPVQKPQSGRRRGIGACALAQTLLQIPVLN